MVDSGTNPCTTGHPCLWCGELTGSRRSYCSDICEERFQKWLECEPATIRGTRPPFWNLIRRQALKRDDHRCQLCGSQIDLSVHNVIPLSLKVGIQPFKTSGYSVIRAIRKNTVVTRR